MKSRYAEGRLVNNRYRVLRALGHGGMGTVYLALDETEDERRVALKCVHRESLDRRTLAILRNEFLSLADLRHPNVVKVYDFAADRETENFFFTCDYVDGMSWIDAVNTINLQTPLDFGIFLDILAQVLRGLHFMHSRGVLHGDIKPENVLVEGLSDEGDSTSQAPGVKLIDFGLAKQENSHGGEKILGTPYYVAPETILGAQVDRRTDLYSLGIVLYHLITGRVPFAGASNLEILRSHVDKEPELPRQINRTISPELESIVLRLLRKCPDERFQDAMEVIDAINRMFTVSLALETCETLSCYVEGARLVGRERELEDLNTVFSALVQSDDDGLDSGEDLQLHFQQSQEVLQEDDIGSLAVRAVILRGEKGLGKRALVEDLRRRAQVRGVACLSVESLASDDFRRFCDALELLEGGAERSMPTYVREARALADADASAETEAEDRRDEVISQIAFGLLEFSLTLPVVIVVHDLHSASRTLFEIIRSVVEFQVASRVPGSRVLVVGSAVNDHHDTNSSVQRLLKRRLFRSSALELRLERLVPEETTRFVHEALPGGDFPDDFYAKVVEESDGNPAMIADILGFYIQKEKLRKSATGWSLEADYLDEEVPGRARRELREHIDRVSSDALRLALAFSCLGETSRLETAAALVDVDRRESKKLARSLCAERILEARPDDAGGDVYGFVFVSARSMLYRMIPDEERGRLHERAGELLEAEAGAGNVQRLAYHYLRSGNRDKGMRFGADAADELAREYSPLDAIEIYERVLGLAREEDAPLVKRLHRRIASLRFEVGEYGSVIDLLEPLFDDTSLTGADRADLYLEAARAYARLGRFSDAERYLGGSTSCFDGAVAEGFSDRHLLVAAELGYYQGRYVESLRHCSRLLGQSKGPLDKTLLCRAFMLKAECCWLLDDKMSAANACQGAIRLLDGQRDASLLAASLFCRGKAYVYKQQLPNALKQFRLSLLLRQKMKMLEGQADCLIEIGGLLLRIGAVGEARRSLEDALSLFERSGNAARMNWCLSLLGETYRLLGEPTNCHVVLRKVLESLSSHGSRRLSMETLLTFAGFSLDRGKLPEAESYLARALTKESVVEGTGSGLMRALSVSCDLAFQRGDIGEACDRAAHGILKARENGNALTLAEFLMRQCYQVCQLGKSGEARRTLVILYDLARRHALRRIESWVRLLEAMVLAIEGRPAKAGSGYQRATELFVAHRNERDLAALYVETGLWSLNEQDHEQAYLDLEEGRYLARKLDLTYLKCRYSLASGKLEQGIGGLESPEAEAELRSARELAEAAGYRGLAWQAARDLGALYLDQQRDSEAVPLIRKATAELEALLPSIPGTYRESYLELTRAGELRPLRERLRESQGV